MSSLEQKKRNFLARIKVEELQRLGLLKKAREDFDRIIAHIIARYNPKRLIQWGSLINGDYFSENSDIDIAVDDEDIDCYQLYRETEAMTHFKLHLTSLSALEKGYAAIVEKYGRVVYEREQTAGSDPLNR